MSVQIMGLKSINGPLVVLDNAREVHYDELAELILEDGSRRTGRVIQIEGQRAVLQVFEGTNGLSLDNYISSYPERWRDKGPVKPGNLLNRLKLRNDS